MNKKDQSHYLAQMKRGKALLENDRALPRFRLALLANFSAQQLTHLLRASFDDVGMFVELFVADFDTAALHAFDEAGPLYAFQPDGALLGLAVQQYRERFLACRSPEERELLPNEYCREVVEMAKVLKRKGLLTTITNLALPQERMFGNFGLMTRQSLYGSVLEFNRQLQVAAQENRCGVLDVMYLSAMAGGEQFLDEKLWMSSKYLCTNRFLPDIAKTIAEHFAAQKGRVKKCLVLDLDNTLWGGVIGDDGLDGIRLGHGDAFGEAFQLFQHYLLSLKHRGFILSVCSKNNDDTARAVFQNHPEMILREEDIAVFVANWNDKAGNIQYIADTLNIGLDSLIFVDDSPFERNLVRSILPQVAVPEMSEDVSEYIATLEQSGFLESTSYSKEDFERNEMYRAEAQRSTEELRFSCLDDYLTSLAIRVKCGPVEKQDLARVAQLLQRSNQFNLCTRRFDEAALERFQNNPDHYLTFAARLSDRFGDYGLISVICGEIREDVLAITELVMSCRVLKRGMEEFMMNVLVDYCKKRGLRGIVGEFRETPKNAMVKNFYPSFGFLAQEQSEQRATWFLDVASYSPRKVFIQEEER